MKRVLAFLGLGFLLYYIICNTLAVILVKIE